MRPTNRRQSIEEAREKKISKYKKFKQAVLSYYGAGSPEELDPRKKKQFYKYIDSEWKRYKASMETDAQVQESLMKSKYIRENDTPEEKIPKNFRPENYYKYYYQAIDAALKYAIAQGYTYDKDEISQELIFHSKRPIPGEYVTLHLPILKNGKSSKKFLQVIVYGMDDAREWYELVTYIN